MQQVTTIEQTDKIPAKTPSAGRLVLQGSSMRIFAFGLNFVSAFFLMPYLIHALGDRGYGMWALIGTIVGQLGLFDAGLMVTTERFMANALARGETDEGIAIYSTSMIIFAGLGTLVWITVGAIVLTAPLWVHQHGGIADFQIALTISGLNLALLFPFAVMQGTLAASLRSDAITVAQTAATIIRTILVVLAVHLGYGLVGLAVANLLTSIVERSILRLMVRRYVPTIRFRPGRASWKMAKELIAFGRFIFVLKLTDGLRYRFSNILIAPMIGVAAVTHFAIASRLADYYSTLVGQISSVSQPVYARHHIRGESDQLREKFLTLSRFGAVICCVFGATVILLGRPFLLLWLGPGYDDSYLAVCVLISAMFFSLLQAPSRDILKVIYKHAFDAKSNSFEVVATILLTLVLVPRFGIMGAALGTAIPMIVVKTFVLPIYVCRTINLRLWTYYVAVLQPMVLTILVTLPLAFLVPASLTHGFAGLALSGAIYASGLLALLTLTLPLTDRKLLTEAIGRKRIEKLALGRLILRFSERW